MSRSSYGYIDPSRNEQYLRLVRERICARLNVSTDFISRIEVIEMPWAIADRLAIQLEAHIYGEQLPPVTRSHTVHVPADWRQAWKEAHTATWWARWWIRRHPPRHKDVTLTTTWENRVNYPWMRLRTSPVPDYMGQAIMVHLAPKSRIEDYFHDESRDL